MRRKEGEYPHKYEKMVTESEFDRVQIILGRKGKPKPKTHEFAFTGMIKCGECGCFVTAENKIKINKGNRHIHHYTYYHCTKRKRELKCLQRCIEIKSLEKQIDSYLQKIQLPGIFKEWGVEYLNSTQNKEIAKRDVVQKSLNKALYDYENQLALLTKMRYKDMIGDEEYLNEKLNLKNEMEKIRQSLKNMGSNEGLNSIVANILEFACNARKWFQKGDLKIRRRILLSVGSNLTLKDKILRIEPVKPYSGLICPDQFSDILRCSDFS